MKISIIIPTLNEEHFVGHLLQDLTQQTYKDFEVIHVDGQSEDATSTVVATYQKHFLIKMFTSSKRNLSYQRNYGAKEANGEYLIFIDADTRISDKNFLKKVAAAISATKCLIYFPMIQVVKSDSALQLILNLYNKTVESSQILATPFCTPGLAIFEHHFFVHIGGYTVTAKHEEKKLFGEDQEILRRAKRAGVSGMQIKTTFFLFSLRRFEREGSLHVLAKLFISTIEQSLGKSFIETRHEMGGHLYNKPKSDIWPY